MILPAVCRYVSRESSNKENNSSQPGWSFTTVRKKKEPKKVSNGTVSWHLWEEYEENVVCL